MGYKNKIKNKSNDKQRDIDSSDEVSYDVFDNIYAKAAINALSEEEKEKYKQIGEHLYGTVQYEKNDTVETNPSIMMEATACIETQLNSGLHPSMMEEDEKCLLESVYGEQWYTRWGYIKEDLESIITLGPTCD